jgi:hypothetical protein
LSCAEYKKKEGTRTRKKVLPPRKTETPDQPISNPIPSAPKKQRSDGHDDQPKSKVKIFVTPIVDFVDVLGPSSSESPGEAPIAKSNCFPRFVFKIGLKTTSHQLVYLDTSAGANVGDRKEHEKIMSQLDPMDYVYERTKMLMRVEGSTAVTNHYVWRVTYLAPYQDEDGKLCDVTVYLYDDVPHLFVLGKPFYKKAKAILDTNKKELFCKSYKTRFRIGYQSVKTSFLPTELLEKKSLDCEETGVNDINEKESADKGVLSDPTVSENRKRSPETGKSDDETEPKKKMKKCFRQTTIKSEGSIDSWVAIENQDDTENFIFFRR